MDSNLRWHNRMKETKDHYKFAGDWLLPVNQNTLCNPGVAILNGWMAEYQEKQWLADSMVSDLSIFCFDNRGQGKSPKTGRLDAVQGAIDANFIISKAFKEYDKKANQYGIKIQNKILQGHCVGTMYIATLFAGKMPLCQKIDGVILISPTSSFKLPFPLNLSYFMPKFVTYFIKKHLSIALTNFLLPSEDSTNSKEMGLKRLNRINPETGIRQAREIFWKENVEKCWSHINVPALILVGKNDPFVKYEQSIEVYNKLRYPVWIELEAPDHLLLETNIEYLSQLIPNFARDPWGFYEKGEYTGPDDLI